MKPLVFVTALLLLFVVLLIAATEKACSQPVNLVGDATATDSTIQLNWPLPQQAGAAWLSRKVSLRDPFTLRWSFVISDTGGEADPSGRSGGDGLAFVIQAMGPQAIGGRGYALGYGKIPNENPGILASFAVEFDTWNDDNLLYWPGFIDFPADHAAVMTTGRGWNTSNGDPVYGALRTVAQIPSIDDGREHAVTVTYAPGLLSVALDSMGTVLRWYGRLDTLLGQDSAFVGWTAATMSAWETHTITSAKWGPCVSDTVTRVDTLERRDTVTRVVTIHDTLQIMLEIHDSVPYPVHDTLETRDTVTLHDTTYTEKFTVVHDTLTPPAIHDTTRACYVRDTCTGVTVPDSICGAWGRGMYLNQPTLRIIALWPNPTTYDATLHYETTGDGLAVITVSDALGRVVRTRYDGDGAGLKVWTFDTGEPGRYEVTLIEGGRVARAAFVVIK